MKLEFIVTIVRPANGQIEVVLEMGGETNRLQIKNHNRELALLCTLAVITGQELMEQLKSEGIFSAPEESPPKNSPGAGAPGREQKEGPR